MIIFKKLIYPCLMSIVVLTPASLGRVPRQTQRIETNQVFHQFPADTVQCRTGDFIVTKSALGGWKVYLVEDLFFMSPLLSMKDSDGLSVVEQIEIADSATPPKWHEIQLLVSEFRKVFATRDRAIAAIESQSLGDFMHGLCRSINEFPKERFEVYQKR